jgi:uncharacterized protein YjiS (DUF1127 family)
MWTVWATLGAWIARSRQRRALRELAERDPHLLQDIGVSRDRALGEAAKWFWQREISAPRRDCRPCARDFMRKTKA